MVIQPILPPAPRVKGLMQGQSSGQELEALSRAPETNVQRGGHQRWPPGFGGTQRWGELVGTSCPPPQHLPNHRGQTRGTESCSSSGPGSSSAGGFKNKREACRVSGPTPRPAVPRPSPAVCTAAACELRLFLCSASSLRLGNRRCQGNQGAKKPKTKHKLTKNPPEKAVFFLFAPCSSSGLVQHPAWLLAPVHRCAGIQCW